jgi:hypothetical protein
MYLENIKIGPPWTNVRRTAVLAALMILAASKKAQ